jgi:hypothetical protein
VVRYRSPISDLASEPEPPEKLSNFDPRHRNTLGRSLDDKPHQPYINATWAQRPPLRSLPLQLPLQCKPRPAARRLICRCSNQNDNIPWSAATRNKRIGSKSCPNGCDHNGVRTKTRYQNRFQTRRDLWCSIKEISVSS